MRVCLLLILLCHTLSCTELPDSTESPVVDQSPHHEENQPSLVVNETSPPRPTDDQDSCVASFVDYILYANDSVTADGDIPVTTETDETEEEEDVLQSFAEFKKKMIDQGVEQHNELEMRPITGVPVTKNYASIECGSKVIETNTGARNPSAILNANKDDYLINDCSAHIYFIVELCELISVRSIVIGSMELFSSIPESFKVFGAERYELDDDWTHIGTFHAANERGEQSFPLNNEEYVYAKFIKVEMTSHYGHERVCPINIFKVIGASMMDMYEESQHNDVGGVVSQPSIIPPLDSEGLGEEDMFMESPSDKKDSEVNGTLLSAAKDAVLRILEQPLEILGKVIKPDGKASNGDHSNQPDAETLPTEDAQKDSQVTTENGEATPTLESSENEDTDHHEVKVQDVETTIEDESATSDKVSPQQATSQNKDLVEDLPVVERKDQRENLIPIDAHPEQPHEVKVQEHCTLDCQSPTTNPPITEETTPTLQDPSPVIDEPPTLNPELCNLTPIDEDALGPVLDDSKPDKLNLESDGGNSTNDTLDELLGPTVAPEVGDPPIDDMGEPPRAAPGTAPEVSYNSEGNDDKHIEDPKSTASLSEDLSISSSFKTEHSTSVRATDPVVTPTLTDQEIITTDFNNEPTHAKPMSTAAIESTAVTNSSHSIATTNSVGSTVGGTSTSRSGESLIVQSTPLAQSLNGSLSTGDTTSTISNGSNTSAGAIAAKNETLQEPSNLVTNGNGAHIPPREKEKSVFLRLSNQIKELEVNMTLFSSYLDQISTSLKRNKNKTEDSTKALDRRMSSLNETLQLLMNETNLKVRFLHELSSELSGLTQAVVNTSLQVSNMDDKMTISIFLLAGVQFLVIAPLLALCCLYQLCSQQSLRRDIATLKSVVADLDHKLLVHTHHSGHNGLSSGTLGHVAGISASHSVCPVVNTDDSERLWPDQLHSTSLDSQHNWMIAENRQRKKHKTKTK